MGRKLGSGLCKSFRQSVSGNITVMFALGLTALCGAAGAAVDFVRVQNVETKVQAAADAAALAAVSYATQASEKSDRAIKSGAEAEALKVWQENLANLSGEELPVPQIKVAQSNGQWRTTISFEGSMPTSLMGVVGIPKMGYAGQAVAGAGGASGPRTLDVAIAIDATASMTSLLDNVKSSARTLGDDINTKVVALGLQPFDVVRVRPIYFRDFMGYKYVYWNPQPEIPLRAAPQFYDTRTQSTELYNFLQPEYALGGGDSPEGGYEAINEALNSRWLRPGDRVSTPSGSKKVENAYSLIIVFTDADAQPPRPSNKDLATAEDYFNSQIPYPSDMPTSYQEFETKWDNPSVIPQTNKMLSVNFVHSVPMNGIEGFTATTTPGWDPAFQWKGYFKTEDITYSQLTSPTTKTIADHIAAMIAAQSGGNKNPRLIN